MRVCTRSLGNPLWSALLTAKTSTNFSQNPKSKIVWSSPNHEMQIYQQHLLEMERKKIANPKL